MASSSTCEAKVSKVLIAQGKQATAAYIHADCSSNPCPQHLNTVLDSVLDPAKSIDERETIDWCKWLMAGGNTPEEFANTVRAYDNQTTCGLVWTPNFVAYRCRTCGMSPCMSLCTDCFKKGNHQRHDFNMFLSQAGGACDCGDTSVMKETGFCDRHGPDKSANKGKAPQNLTCVAEAMMPRIIFRFLLHLRENFSVRGPIQEAADYITMLQDFNNMGALMRRVMTSALTNPQKYKDLNDVSDSSKNEHDLYVYKTKKLHEKAMACLANPEPFEHYKDCRPLQPHLVHKTFLEELVFWTVYFEFPEKIVCLLLNMLPDLDYKEALMRAIVLHYTRISLMLERTVDSENVSNRVVHATVQLFSNESLALQMTQQMNLLHVMVLSLRYMVDKILVANTLHSFTRNEHRVVDCRTQVMANHCYWPLVSDLNNVLSHRSVALKFMADDGLVQQWFIFLNMFQGMNTNQKELKEHVMYDANTYFAAFSAELEACAYPMWAIVSHLTDDSTAHLTKKVLKACDEQLDLWLDQICYNGPSVHDHVQVSFHLPLHRYFSVFLCQGVGKQGITLDEVMPRTIDLELMIMHPLKVLICFYEVLRGLWKKNGLQMTGQAMTYIQGNFCNSMVDADIYLLQVSCTRLCPNRFMTTLLNQFHVNETLSVAPVKPQNPYIDPEHNMVILDSFLLFLTTLVTVRTNIGLSETEVNRLEMVTLLCVKDRTHSQLMELVPERCGTSQTHDFEALLAELADYRPPVVNPNGANLQQGMYSVKAEVWEKLYDPIYLMLRAVHRTDPNTAYTRYCSYVESTKKCKQKCEPWFPFREPKKCSQAYPDPRLILKSRVFHAAAFVILYQSVQGQVPESTMALIIFLLDQTITISQTRQPKNPEPCMQSPPPFLKDMRFKTWFTSDCIFENLTTVIQTVLLTYGHRLSTVSSTGFESGATSESDRTDLSPTRLQVLDEFLQEAMPQPMMAPVNQDPIHKHSTFPMDQDGPPFLSTPSFDTPPKSSVPEQLEPSTSGGGAETTPPSGNLLTISAPNVSVNESIISLLLRLHSLFSGVPNSYKPEEMGDGEDDGSMIGDGVFFIGRLLNKISRMDETCKQCIQDTRMRIWPTQECEEAKQRERGERKRRAEERRAKLMAEMANKQKEFMEMAMETDENAFDSDEDVKPVNDEVVTRQEYECIICNKSSPSSEDKPIGLVSWIQPSNVTGQRRRHEQGVLPTCDEERSLLKNDANLYTDLFNKIFQLGTHFNSESWYLSVGAGLDGGVHVQTCGHYVHLDCLNPYLQILNREDFECPLCKSLGNGVLPITPELGIYPQGGKSSRPMSQILYELREFLEGNDLNPANSPMMEAIGRAIETITIRNQPRPNMPLRKEEPIFQGLSVARTNLETELCQRGGTLVTSRQPPNPLLPKKDCIVPLLRVLAVSARVARASARWPAWITFQQLRGMSPKTPSDTPVGPIENELPILLKDPVSILLQFVILLPQNLDQSYFRTTVQIVYNLLYYQVVAQISCGLTGTERMMAALGANPGNICTLADAFALINKCLGNTGLYMHDVGMCNETSGKLNMIALELQVQKLCLPYLRIAALLQCHVYQIPLPEITQTQTEFFSLVHYLELVTEPIDWVRFNAAAALNWPTESQMFVTSPLAWFNQYTVFVQKNQCAARSLLMNQHITWHRPRLLQLPREYEKIFTYYHKRPCDKCHSVPLEAAICLLCGTLVCLRQNCCKKFNMGEAICHSIHCSAGNGIFLIVTSTYTIVVRGRQACLWGSLYLDEFAEEDRDLKRGKPLYLSNERFQLLEQQWLAHRIDHIKKNWVFHNNAL